MKRKVIIFFFLIQYINGYCQVISNCNIAEELRDAYAIDVSHLAVTRIFETNSPYMDSISVPESVKDTIWAGLAAVYNAFSIPERDSIFDIYCIHDSKNWSIYPHQNIRVTVDSQYSWTSNWENLNIKTGYSELDTFVSLYGLKLDHSVSGNWAYFFTIFNYVNITPFIDSLKKFDGIIDVGLAELYGDGNRIYYDKIIDKKIFEFVLGIDECKWNCIYFYSWKFEVDSNCNVTLIEIIHKTTSSNDYLKEYLVENCNITNNIRNQNIDKSPFFSIFPNPANNFIYITSESNHVYYVSIYDLLGERLFIKKFLKEIKISLINYKSGFYLINIYDENYEFYKAIKIIKE